MTVEPGQVYQLHSDPDVAGPIFVVLGPAVGPVRDGPVGATYPAGAWLLLVLGESRYFRATSFAYEFGDVLLSSRWKRVA